MKKLILIILGVISALYGILILQVGSGTSFWLIWEAIGACFFAWALLVQKGFFEKYKKAGRIFHVLVAMAIMVLTVFCGMIGTKFASNGSQNLDYIIVLGAQVREDGPSVVLKYRLDAAIDYLTENPDTMCIVSGGKGQNEPVSEAEGMSKYLIQNGIDSARIVLEDKSTNTVENIKNSKELMELPCNGIGIVTNNFHVFRATQIAEKQGLEGVYGIAANSNVLYLPNNVLRECCGILKDWIFGNM